MEMLLYHQGLSGLASEGSRDPTGMGMVVMLSGAAAPGETMPRVLVELSHHLQSSCMGTRQPLSSHQLWLILHLYVLPRRI